MDVERIQKINGLALDLMRQGLAQTRDDAVAQAEKIFNRQESSDDDYSSIRERMENIQADAAPKSSPHSGEEMPVEKVKDILEQNSKFLVKTIKEFQERIAVLEKDISTLRSQASRPVMPPAPQPTSVSSSPSIASNPSGRGSQAQQNDSSGHPRSGNYNVQDVSIEKFFYMGKK